ncbi:MAG: CARDB domain-containing protein [Candidatus Omnitrophota bacterium]
MYRVLFIFSLTSFFIFFLNSTKFLVLAQQEGESCPDLIVSGIVNLDSPLYINENRKIKIIIGNLNRVDARNVKVKYEIRNLNVFEKDRFHGYLKGKKVLGRVEAGKTRDFVLNYKGVYPAHYELGVTVDPGGRVSETDKGNNLSAKQFRVEGDLTPGIFFAGKGKRIDLALDKKIGVSTLEPPAGISVNFLVTVNNNSDLEIWGADLDMYADGKLVANQPLENLPAYGNKETSLYYAFSAGGGRKVEFVVNSKGIIPERKRANNSASIWITVKPGAYGTGVKDVAVTSFVLDKEITLEGQSVKAEVLVKNSGKDTLNNVLCAIGLKDQKPFYIKILPILDPGQEVKLEVMIPALAAGEHIIEARVDGKNIVKELNEDNNVRSVSLYVEKITGEHVKAKGAIIIPEKIGRAIAAVNRWLRGPGQFRQ